MIDKYLDYAIHYDYTFVVVKYTAQQILGSMQESVMGKKFLASSTMRDLCTAFGREADLDRRQAWIKAKSEEMNGSSRTPGGAGGDGGPGSEMSMRQAGAMADFISVHTLYCTKEKCSPCH